TRAARRRACARGGAAGAGGRRRRARPSGRGGSSRCARALRRRAAARRGAGLLREAERLRSRPVAWLLPGRRLEVSVPVATDLRFAWMREQLDRLGYRPVVIGERPGAGGWGAALAGLLSTPRLGYLALRDRPSLVYTNS